MGYKVAKKGQEPSACCFFRGCCQVGASPAAQLLEQIHPNPKLFPALCTDSTFHIYTLGASHVISHLERA